tara:strand:- start:714 stop:1109 length:396 start_codon:yes stop_codon:yes gene_type:complete
MKNLLLSFLIVIAIFLVACEEDDVKPFEGTWSGTYTGGDSGSWQMVVIYENGESYGTINGTTNFYNGGSTGIFGSVDSYGTITGAFVDETITTIGGTVWNGKFELNDAAGTWEGKDPNGSSVEGTWTGKKN